MKKTFGLTHALTLFLLFTIILAPRPLAGSLDLASAGRFEAASDHASAANAYASAARRLPWRVDLWGQAGQAAWLAQEPEQAVRWFAEAESRAALSLADWLTYGDSFQLLGDPRSAAWAWQQSVERFGPSAGAESRLAGVYRSEGDYPQALASLRLALQLAPDEAELHYELGLLLAATDPEEALAELMLAARMNPAHDVEVQDLRSALNTALLSEERAYQFVVSGRALAALGEWDLAQEAFRRATEADPLYAEAWAWLGEARQAAGLDGSLELGQALALDPWSAMVQGLYGLLLQRQGQPFSALEAYQAAATLEPQDPGWQIAIAGAYEQAGDLINAADHTLRALELDRESAANWRALALFSLRNSMDVEGVGLTAARQLVRLAAADWQTYDILGQVLTVTGDFGAAAQALDTALELAPEQAAPALHMGLLCLQSGDQVCAYDALMDASQLDADGASGWQARRLLEQYFP